MENSVFIAGRYTNDDDTDGLYLFELRKNGSEIIRKKTFFAGPDPSFICYNSEKDLIYVTNEVMQFNNEDGGGLSTFRYLHGRDSIVRISDITIPFGGPCHVSITPGRDYLLVANYLNASVIVVKLDREKVPEAVTDTLRFDPEGDMVSHAHMIKCDPGGEKVYVTDLGRDRILVYKLDVTDGKLLPSGNSEVKLPQGSGPRHFVFNSDGTRMYVINELGSTVSVLKRKETGDLSIMQTLSTLPAGFNGENYCAEIFSDKRGRFLYASNRGHNSIAVFRISADGMLEMNGTAPCGGDWPRYITPDPSGKFLLSGNQRSGNISVFSVDRKTGMPAKLISTVEIPGVACIVFPE